MNKETDQVVKRRGLLPWVKGFGVSAVVALLVVNFLIAAQTPRKAEEDSQRETAYRTTKLWEEVRELVRQNYVEGNDKINYESLTYNALKGMLDSLDPHSQFLEPKMLKQMREETNQKFGGLGIEITHRDGLPTVIAPIEDTPAFRAGLMPGDKIFKIDGQRTDRMKLSEVVGRLKGVPGTQVTIQIFRLRAKKAEDRFKDITLKREEIKVASIKDIKMVNEKEKIGYLRITQFGDQTDEELEKALKELEKQGVRALVMDLRGNPGGLLDTAQNVCEKFIDDGQLVVKTSGRRASQSKSFFAHNGKPRRYPLAVLVNNASASASEIVAGCLQDLKRAILVGEKTFGKGSVQSIIELEPIELKDDEGKPAKLPVAVKITTAEYRTPSNKRIHGVGITPDIYVPLSDEDMERLYEQRIAEKMGEKPAPADEPPLPGEQPKEKPVEDSQLNRAVDALLGVLIFAQNQPAAAETHASK